MSRINRRRFLHTSSTLAAATALRSISSGSPVRADSPNERPKVAVIGCGGQGTGDGRRATNYGDIIAVCDVDTSHSAYAKAAYTRRAAAKGKQAAVADGGAAGTTDADADLQARLDDLRRE